MTEKEKKELKHIERFIRSMGLLKEANLILKTQKELDKKDKVINYIFEYLTDTEWDNCCFECKQLHNCLQDYDVLLECIKQYFYKKAEGKDE